MVQYFDTKDVLENRKELKQAHKEKISFFVRNDIVLDCIKDCAKESQILELGCGGGYLLRKLLRN